MSKKILSLFILITFAALALYIILTHIKSKNPYLTVSGRVEADEIELAARVPGRLERVFIEDGTTINKNDTVAVIDDRELQSKRREVLDKIKELNEKIHAAELDLDYTSDNIDHSIDEAGKTLAVANTRLRQAEVKKENDEREFKRYSNLIEKDVISKQRYDSAKLAYELSQEEVNVALKEVEKAKLLLIKTEDLKMLKRAKEKELLALRRSASQLKEVLHQAEINIGYTVVNAPLDGIILKKVSEPGEIITLGGVIGVMIDPADVYIKTYVPEKYIGMININMQANIFTDAYPDKPFSGNVCYISDKAEFTPKEVQSYEERVKQVFAVKICFPQKGSSSLKGKATYEIFKKGMPVDVRFDIKTE
jgi:HlyD family secretion protein